VGLPKRPVRMLQRGPHAGILPALTVCSACRPYFDHAAPLSVAANHEIALFENPERLFTENQIDSLKDSRGSKILKRKDRSLWSGPPVNRLFRLRPAYFLHGIFSVTCRVMNVAFRLINLALSF
jgi:hypothetical protein